MRRLIAAAFTAAAMTALVTSSALAVPLHQHYISTPGGGSVPIAHGICANELQTAIDNLHAHVHLGAPTTAFAMEANPIGFSVSSCP